MHAHEEHAPSLLLLPAEAQRACVADLMPRQPRLPSDWTESHAGGSGASQESIAHTAHNLSPLPGTPESHGELSTSMRLDSIGEDYLPPAYGKAKAPTVLGCIPVVRHPSGGPLEVLQHYAGCAQSMQHHMQGWPNTTSRPPALPPPVSSPASAAAALLGSTGHAVPSTPQLLQLLPPPSPSAMLSLAPALSMPSTLLEAHASRLQYSTTVADAQVRRFWQHDSYADDPAHDGAI